MAMPSDEIPWELIVKLPLLPLPPGVTQNLDNPESRAYWMYITVGLCLPLILFFAAIRFYVKFCIIKARTRDDCKSPIESRRKLIALRDTGLILEYQTFASSVWYVPAQSRLMVESAVDMNLAVFCDYIPCLYPCSYVPADSLTMSLVDVFTSL